MRCVRAEKEGLAEESEESTEDDQQVTEEGRALHIALVYVIKKR